MGGVASKSIMENVEAILSSDHGKTPEQVHEALDCWSRVTVRAALRQLVEEGRATFTGNHCSRLYRRAAG